MKYKKIRKIYRFFFPRKEIPIFNWKDVSLLVDDWCRFLPKNFDCIIGIPRQGLIIADFIAENLALPLSVPELFLKGIVWQSRVFNVPQTFKNVLVVDDSVQTGRELVYAIQCLRRDFPKCKFSSGSLIRHTGCKLNLDYCYVSDDSILLCGDISGKSIGFRLKSEDFS